MIKLQKESTSLPRSENGSGFNHQPDNSQNDFSFGKALHTIFIGFRKICPNCRKAKMFGTGKKFWTMHETCPNCDVRFARETGEYIVAMYVNIFLTEIIFITGYLLLDYFYDLSVVVQLSIWAPFNFLFPIWFYPRSKGVWAAILSMMGGLYRD